MAARGAAELRWATERRRSDSGASRAARLAGTRLQASSLLRRALRSCWFAAPSCVRVVQKAVASCAWQLRYSVCREQARAEKVDLRLAAMALWRHGLKAKHVTPSRF